MADHLIPGLFNELALTIEAIDGSYDGHWSATDEEFHVVFDPELDMFAPKFENLAVASFGWSLSSFEEPHEASANVIVAGFDYETPGYPIRYPLDLYFDAADEELIRPGNHVVPSVAILTPEGDDYQKGIPFARIPKPTTPFELTEHTPEYDAFRRVNSNRQLITPVMAASLMATMQSIRGLLDCAGHEELITLVK